MRRADAGVLLVGMLAVAACEQATIVQPELRSQFPPPALNVGDPQSGTITLPTVDPITGGATQTTNQQPSKYIVTMKLTGSSSITVKKRVTQATDPDPAVLYARHGLRVSVTSGNTLVAHHPFTGATNGALTMLLTLNRYQVISSVSHTGGTQGTQSGDNPDGSDWECGGSVNPCYEFEGSGGTVSITPLQGNLVLNADSTTVSIGSTVKFTIDSSVVEGKSLGIEVDTAKWIPDAESEGGEYTEFHPGLASCFTGWPLTCSKQILGSGTLEVVAHVNGSRKVQSKHIDVREGKLRLTGDKSSIAKGESVRFTASWSDGFAVNVDGWKFLPDTTPDVTGACGQGVNPCNRVIQQNGTMVVTVLRNGKKRTARARVNIVPCPTNDSILDHPRVRKMIDSLFKLADVSGVNPKERWMDVFDSLGTLVVRIAPVHSYDNACRSIRWPELQGPLRRVASFHVHPVAPGDSLYCPGEAPGTASDRFGGPSTQDWQARRGSTVTEYIINPKQIQRMDRPPDGAPNWYDARDREGILRTYPTPNVKNFVKNHARTVNSCSRY